MFRLSAGGLLAALALVSTAALAAQEPAPDRGAPTSNTTPTNAPGTNAPAGARGRRGDGFGRGPLPAGPTTPFGTPDLELKPFLMDPPPRSRRRPYRHALVRGDGGEMSGELPILSIAHSAGQLF